MLAYTGFILLKEADAHFPFGSNVANSSRILNVDTPSPGRSLGKCSGHTRMLGKAMGVGNRLSGHGK